MLKSRYQEQGLSCEFTAPELTSTNTFSTPDVEMSFAPLKAGIADGRRTARSSVELGCPSAR